MNLRQHITIFALILLAAPLSAQEYSFEKMHSMMLNSQAELKSLEKTVELTELKESSVGRHWHPQLYLSGSYVSSDDSGFGLFSKLQQRQIAQTDFQPADLNKSKMDYLMSAGLGVRVNLFEGFRYQNLSKATAYELEAQQVRLSHTKQQKKAELLKAYSGLLIQQKYQAELSKTKTLIEKIVKNYKIGKRSNPVGYSGKLGLRALVNKTAILLDKTEAKIAQLRGEIEVLVPELPSNWQVAAQNFLPLVQQQTPKMTGEFLKQKSQQIVMREKMEKAMAAAADSLNSKYWPSVGAFAESKFVNGDRDSTDVNTIGLQLQWNLYDPGNVNNAEVARAQKSQEQWLTQEYRKKEISGRKTIFTSYPVALTSLQTMNQSKVLLEEQVKVSRRLFRSGVLNAINLSQVFSQYCDLLDNLLILEDQVIALHAQALILSAGK